MTKLSEQIIELQKQGKPYSQIQIELGCSKGTISYHLGAGQKEKNVARQNRGRKTILNFMQQYKQSRVCTDCKEDYPYWMMEFDHLGDKEFTIGNYKETTGSLERVKREISKCEVVCSNCHKNRTHFRSLDSGDYTLNISEFYKIEGHT